MMKLVVVGAAGRMGRMLISTIAETPQLALHAAIESARSPHLGADSGVLAGLPANGIAVTSDALAAFVDADAVVDFTVPQATVEFAALAAQARIVHIVGTTGLDAADLAALSAAAQLSAITRLFLQVVASVSSWRIRLRTARSLPAAR